MLKRTYVTWPLLRLFAKKCTSAQFHAFRSVNHVIYTLEINKICLNAWDDKRYIKDDGIHSWAYGHKDVPEKQDSENPKPLPVKSLRELAAMALINSGI